MSTIDAMYASLGTLSLYELLGVPRDATKEQIDLAHDALRAAFRPARFGSLISPVERRKLEIVLLVIDDAHETLASAETRAAYDGVQSPRG
jgi:DnaJ-class molecular chaperone